MKKIFRTTYLALLLIAGLSCNNDPMPDAPKGKYPILFRCSDETRAVATVESMKSDTNGFDVYAYIEASTGAKVNFAKNVIWDKDQLMWLYDDIEYWVVGAKYWFKAVYPHDIHNIAKVDNDDRTQAVTIEGYEISNQYDILVAETEGLEVTAEHQAPASGSVVELQFQHLLANVTIKVLSELDATVNIERIELRQVALTADYNINWSNNGSGDFGFNSTIALTKATSDTDYTDITSGGILVIPERINGKQKLYVKTQFKEYEIAFPTTYAWNAGQKYTYTLIIKQEYIEFNEPKVEIWDEENATGSVVIK